MPLLNKKLCGSILSVAFVLSLVAFRTQTPATKIEPFTEPKPDCAAVFSNNQNAIHKFKKWRPSRNWTEDQLLHLTSDCQSLKKEFHFPSMPLSEGEKGFPLAYATIAHNHPEQLIRMLSSLYWPQNIYCITYDTKASDAFKDIIHNLEKCFNNVILPNEHFYIEWGRFGTLQAAVNCLRALHRTGHGWRYVQVISGHTLPLKTNRDMVQIFKIFGGANDCEMIYTSKRRFEMKNDKPPGKITVIKGSFAASLSREFVGFMLENNVAQEYFEWLNGTGIPDESYWSSLIHNDHLNAPGNFPRKCLRVYERKGKRKMFISRFQIWDHDKNCKGKMLRNSCIFGVGDLPNLSKQPHLVAHKIYLEFEPATFHCLVELIHNRTERIDWREIKRKSTINITNNYLQYSTRKRKTKLHFTVRLV